MEDEDDIDDGIDDEEMESIREAREALKSAALSRIMNAGRRGGVRQSLDDSILGGWKIIGYRHGFTGYSGCIQIETMLKNPRKYSGKIKLYDPYVAVYSGGDRVEMHKVQFSGGLRKSDEDIFAEIIAKRCPEGWRK